MPPASVTLPCPDLAELAKRPVRPQAMGKLSAADLQLLPGNQSVPPGGDLQSAFRNDQGAFAAQGVIVDGLHRKAAPAGDKQVALHADGGFPHLAAGIEVAFAIGEGIFGAVLQQQHHGAAAIGVDDRAPFTVHIHPAQHQPGRFPRGDLHGELGILQSTAEQVGAPWEMMTREAVAVTLGALLMTESTLNCRI